MTVEQQKAQKIAEKLKKLQEMYDEIYDEINKSLDNEIARSEVFYLLDDEHDLGGAANTLQTFATTGAI